MRFHVPLVVLLASSGTAFGQLDCATAPMIEYGDTAFETSDSTEVLDFTGYCDPGPFGDDALHNTIYYRFTPTADGLHTFSTCNQADFDTRLAVLGSCDPTSVISCLDDSGGCAGYTTHLVTNLTAGVEVIVAIGGYSNADLGTGILSVGGVEQPDTTNSLSLNFQGGTFWDGSDGGACYESNIFPAGADGYRTLHWQNMRGPWATDAQMWADKGMGDSPTSIVDGNGAETGAWIDYAANNTWRVLSYNYSNTELMRRGYLDSNGLGGVSATISGIEYETYTAVLYFNSDGNDRAGWATANDAEAVHFYTENASLEGYLWPDLVQATATTEADAVRSHYAVFEGLAGDVCAISITQLGGSNIGLNGVQIIDAGSGGSCTGDFNGDGEVNGADIGLLLAAWGPCAGCPEDLSGDEIVDGADIGLMLAAWGLCP